MALKLALLAPLALALACGGTTDGSNEGGGGTSAGAGGQGGGGKNGGGTSNAGTSNAGTASGGTGAGSGGAAGNGGTGLGGAGAAGAGGYYNPSCPAHEPMGACFTPGVSCDYNYFNGCLCYAAPADAFTPCIQVDPTCTAAGGAAASPAPDLGSGGISAKVALPPQQRCVCAVTAQDAAGGGAAIPAPSGNWICSR